MWVVFLDNETQARALQTAFSKVGFEYEPIVTSFGGVVYKSPEIKRGPHLALRPPEKTRLKNLFDWVHLNLNPNVMVSSGFCKSYASAESQKPQILLPKLCLRSAGRVDVGGPVLFEEIAFEPSLHSFFTERLKDLSVSSDDKLFSAEKIRADQETHEWIQKYLHCQGTDSFSGELLLMCKRVSVRTACMKAVAQSEDEAIEVLVRAWMAMMPISPV